ncbi:holin [Microbacterium sp. NPDC059771]|uniref:holin n=1 Tax=Microbacterium sp. NPDC059771 TaxID=3346941 RepID=UPI00366197DC
MSKLTDRTWWKAALLRALYTAIAIVLPYLGGALLADVPWITAASAAALGFLASLATSIAGLPETQGTNLPWWLAAVERVVKTFAQALAAGFLGATLLSDVPWSTVVQAALIAALTSLLRLVLATLPQDPTMQPSDGITIRGPLRLSGTAIVVDQVNHFDTTDPREAAELTSTQLRRDLKGE